MTKVDTAWLRMDSPGNLMMIVGVWTLKPAYPVSPSCANGSRSGCSGTTVFASGWRKTRPVRPGARTPSSTSPVMSFAKSCPESGQGPAAGGAAGPGRRAGDAAAGPPHPLWQFHLVEDYDGGSALIARIHHCIADGIALISVTMSLVDGGASPPARKRSQAAVDAEDWISKTLVKPFTDLTLKALGAAGGGAVAFAADCCSTRKKAWPAPLGLGRLAYQVACDAAALALMPDDSPTRLKGKPGTSKRVAWCQPIPLDEVKAVGKALNCSVNDVLLSCVAGAIGDYLQSQGDDTTGQEIRAMIPVNLRTAEHAHELGNRFGLVPLVLPIGIDNPVERVYEVRRRMNALKGSTQPLLAFGLLAWRVC